MTAIILAALTTNVQSDFSITYEGKTDDPNDLWGDVTKKFNLNKFNTLLQQISGDKSVTASNMSKIEEMAEAKATSANFRTNNSGQDITVMLGGLRWTATYLSQDKEGNPILTLWLDDNQQDAWKDRAADEGQYYGFLNGALYSDWAANWSADNPTEAYPSNMYGTSYMSSVVLNNGGTYATSGTATATATQSESNPFALFTMSKFGLTQYLVTPEHVAWQEDGQSAKTEISDISYNLPNENWSQSTTVGNFNGNYHYDEKTGNDAWKDDYLWLPSLSETGDDNTSNGIWETSTAQRKLINTSISSVGNVGSSNGTGAYNYSWLRSGSYNFAYYAFYLRPPGDDWNYYDVYDSYAVRPALHLNLTAAANSLI